MNEERLAEIKERLEGKAIIGELYVKGDPWKGYEVIDDHNGMRIAELSNGTEAQFLANAPKDISELVAEVEFLLAVRDGQAHMIQKLHAENRGYVAEIARLKHELGEQSAHNGTLIVSKIIPINKENERLRKALEFYAKRETYFDDNAEEFHEIFLDFGAIAREALQNGD